MTRKEKIDEQIRLAQSVLKRKYHGNIKGMSVVITSNKTSPLSRKEFFAFHFEPENSVKVGDILPRKDVTITKVEHIIQ